MGGRVVLVALSPRVPPGLLSWPAWEALRSGPVRTADAGSPQLPFLRDAGVDVLVEQPDVEDLHPRALAGESIVWLAPDAELARADRTPDDLLRAGERREPGGHAVEHARPALLGALGRLPALLDLGGVAHDGVREHVRVAAAQLGGDAGRDVVEVEGCVRVLLCHAGVEDDLQQDVTELLAEVVPVAVLDRLDELEGLLDRVPREGGVRLLGIPRAAARRAQPVHDRDEVGDAGAGHRSPGSPPGTVGARAVTAGHAGAHASGWAIHDGATGAMRPLSASNAP